MGTIWSFRGWRDFCIKHELKSIVLHACEPNLLRGYPCNVGLDYVKANERDFDFVSFLDDDDIYYQNFAHRLAHALELTGADLVYSESNRREPWLEHVVGPRLLPEASLVTCNFITNSSFALRTDALIKCGVSFNEDMEYLEDWELLNFPVMQRRSVCSYI